VLELNSINNFSDVKFVLIEDIIADDPDPTIKLSVSIFAVFPKV